MKVWVFICVAEGNVINSFHYVNKSCVISTPSAVTIRKSMKDKFTLKTHTNTQKATEFGSHYHNPVNEGTTSTYRRTCNKNREKERLVTLEKKNFFWILKNRHSSCLDHVHITSNILQWLILFPKEKENKNVTQVWIFVVQPESEVGVLAVLMNNASDFSNRKTISEEDNSSHAGSLTKCVTAFK